MILRGSFTAAISGGVTPRALHRMLAEEPFLFRIPWDRTHIFWVDERCVPQSDPASNYGAAREDFLNRIPIPIEQIHPMPGNIPPEDGAMKYQKELMDCLDPPAGELPVLDLVLLGLGKDGHSASLFPGQESLDEKERLVLAVKSGNPNVNRLTMTLPVLNNARRIVFMVAGREKASVVRSVLEDRQADLPAQRIQPIHGKPTWLLDCEAASGRRRINPSTTDA